MILYGSIGYMIGGCGGGQEGGRMKEEESSSSDGTAMQLKEDVMAASPYHSSVGNHPCKFSSILLYNALCMKMPKQTQN